jgi:hypothetical protein
VKRVINGITFNTNTSALIARYRFFDGGGPTYGISKAVSVFQTRGGDFFELYAWTERGRHDSQYCLRPLTRADLAFVLKKAKNLEVIDRAALLGEHPREFEESRTEATVFVRLPMNLKRRLDDAARQAGKSVNSYALRLFERSLGAVGAG